MGGGSASLGFSSNRFASNRQSLLSVLGRLFIAWRAHTRFASIKATYPQTLAQPICPLGKVICGHYDDFDLPVAVLQSCGLLHFKVNSMTEQGMDDGEISSGSQSMLE